MYRSETKIKVRYAETDQMGFVYYGNYAVYYEIARVECLRRLGFVYKDLEDRGFILPVISYHINFLKPAFYDDEITVKVTVSEMPSVRITFDYESFNSKGEKINEGTAVLVFMDKKKQAPCHPPRDFIDKIAPFFSPSKN